MNKTKAYFKQHIPDFVSGTRPIEFNFKDGNDLLKQITEKGVELGENEIWVKAEYYIMKQSTKKRWWWVMGYVYNYDMDNIDIPRFDSELVTEDES